MDTLRTIRAQWVWHFATSVEDISRDPGRTKRQYDLLELIRELGKSRPGPDKFHQPPMEFRDEICYLVDCLEHEVAPTSLTDEQMNKLVQLVKELEEMEAQLRSMLQLLKGTVGPGWNGLYNALKTVTRAGIVPTVREVMIKAVEVVQRSKKFTNVIGADKARASAIELKDLQWA